MNSYTVSRGNWPPHAQAFKEQSRQTDALAQYVARDRVNLNRIKSLRLNSQLLVGGEFGRP